MCSMKALARSYVWWPKLDAYLQSKVRACAVYQTVRATPTKLPFHPWVYPKRYLQKATLIVVKI